MHQSSLLLHHRLILHVRKSRKAASPVILETGVLLASWLLRTTSTMTSLLVHAARADTLTRLFLLQEKRHCPVLPNGGWMASSLLLVQFGVNNEVEWPVLLEKLGVVQKVKTRKDPSEEATTAVLFFSVTDGLSFFLGQGVLVHAQVGLPGVGDSLLDVSYLLVGQLGPLAVLRLGVHRLACAHHRGQTLTRCASVSYLGLLGRRVRHYPLFHLDNPRQ